MKTLYDIFFIVTMVLAIGTLVYTYVDIFLTRRGEKHPQKKVDEVKPEEQPEEQTEEQTEEQPSEEEATEDVK